MYIDNLYTKLYSERDWNGLNQLVNEIKSFARKDYEGLGTVGRLIQRLSRMDDARRVKYVRNKFGHTSPAADIALRHSKRDSDDLRDRLNLFRSDQLRRDEKFLNDLKKSGVDLKPVIEGADNVKHAVKGALGIPSGLTESRSLITDALEAKRFMDKDETDPINQFLANRIADSGMDSMNRVANNVKDRWNNFISRFKK